MEAEAAHTPLLAPGGGERVGRGRGRHRGVKRRVEARDLRKRGPEPTDRAHAFDGARLMERREWREREQRLLDVGGDPDRRAELGSAVHDSMADRVDRGPVGEKRGESRVLVAAARGFEIARGLDVVVGIEDAQLDAARPCVHHEHAHQRGQAQSRTSGRSSPCARTYSPCRVR